MHAGIDGIFGRIDCLFNAAFGGAHIAPKCTLAFEGFVSFPARLGVPGADVRPMFGGVLAVALASRACLDDRGKALRFNLEKPLLEIVEIEFCRG